MHSSYKLRNRPFAFEMLSFLRRMRARTARVFTVLLVVSGLVAVPQVIAQEAPDTASGDTGLGSGEGFLLWDLIGEAHPFQYPIFGLLAIGLFLISAKLYELYKDRQAAEELEEASLEDMGMKRIAMLVANQKKSMLADLQATMINVYQTTQDAATLHEEIANFVRFQRDRFDTFKLRIDFLADTAGAVGLLGTVWGILTVFTGGGIDDEQRVLAGMGTALVSTLLGLVVSITLNLISTEVYSFFDNRLDEIEDKADELRFRLLELGLSENGTQESVPDRASETSTASSEQDGRRDRPVRESGPAQAEEASSLKQASGRVDEPVQSAPSSESPASPKTVAEPIPHGLDVEDCPDTATVASTLSGVQLKVIGEDGEPVPDEPVRIAVGNESGELDDGISEITRRTDEQGIVAFNWHLPETADSCEAVATVPSSDLSGTSTRLSVEALPGPPKHYGQKGNNQGAEMGEPLPKPLTVKLFDHYENPVPDQEVEFRVESGGGTFKNGEQSITVKTDAKGKAAVEYRAGPEPGLNTVTASVGDEQVSFQAMTLEQ